jgi:hypothetical protein
MDTMISGGTDWHADLQEWLQPFLAAFKRSEQRCWAPLYLQALLVLQLYFMTSSFAAANGTSLLWLDDDAANATSE